MVALLASALSVMGAIGVAAPAGASGAYEAAVLASSPVGYWRFDDAAGAALADDAAGGEDLTYSDASQQTRVGGALIGDPSTANRGRGNIGASLKKASLSNAAAYWAPETSAEFWMLTRPAATRYHVFHIDSSSTPGFVFSVFSEADHSLFVQVLTEKPGVGDLTVPIRTAPLSDGVFHHVAVTVSQGEIGVYVDARLVATEATAGFGMVDRGSNALSLSSSSKDNDLDEMAFYDHALTPSEVRSHYAASGRVPPPLPRSDELDRPNAAKKCGCDRNGVGQPIDTLSGNLYESLPGLSVPGRGPGLAFGLEFNSADVARAGAAGPGWSSVLDMRLSTEADGTKVVRQENGAGSYFAPSGGGWVAGPHATATLTFDSASNTFEYTRQHFTMFRFDATSGLLKSISNLAGDTTTLAYGDPSKPTRATSMTDSAGRSLTFAWNAAGDRLVSVTDPLVGPGGPRSIKLEYTAGDLTAYYDTAANKTAPADAWVMTYDSSHRLTARQAPKQTALTQSVRTEYDGSGRAFRQTDQEGRITKLTYGSPSAGSTKIEYQNPSGTTLRTQVDSYVEGRREQTVIGYGTPDAVTTTYGFEPWTRVLTSTSVNGKVTTYDPDPVTGSYRSITDPTGLRTEWTYNKFDQPLTERAGLKVGAGGAVSTAEKIDSAWTYDSAGRLLTTKSPVGVAGLEATVTYNRDPAHPEDVTSTVDGEGMTWTATYDAGTGYVLTASDPLLNTTKTTYNNIGWPTTSTAPEGVATTGVAGDWETTYSYDIAARSTTTRLPTGEKTRTILDTNGNTVSVESGLTDTIATGDLTTYTYNNANQILKTFPPANPPLSISKEYAYDGLGQQVSFKNELNATWATSYDPAGRVKTETDPLSRISTYRYNAAGQLASVEQPGTGATCTAGTKKWCTSYSYDDAGRPTAVDYSEAGETDITDIAYDALGRRLTATKSDGHNEAWTWFATSMLKSHTDANGDTTNYTWDRNGNQETITYPGPKTVTRTYDDAGRLKTVADWLPAPNTSTFDYDKNSNWKTTTFPTVTGTGTVDNYTYDQSGRMSTASWTKTGTPTPLGAETYTRPAGDKGMLTAITPNTGPAKAFAYDNRDRLADAATAVYDDAGNLTKRADGASQVFDPAQQLCWSSPTITTGTCAAAPVDATTYSYDARGNRTTSDPADGFASTYTYDQANRLKTATVPDTSEDGQYHPSIARILDTRTTPGLASCTGTCVIGGLNTNQSLSAQVEGTAGLPADGIAAVAITVTAQPASGTANGYLRINDTGSTGAGRVTINGSATTNSFMIVPVVAGKVNVKLFSATCTDVIIDITGYFTEAPTTGGDTYQPLIPSRIANTETGIGTCTPAGSSTATTCASPVAGTVTKVHVAGEGTVPSTGASAVIVGVTVLTKSTTGYLKVNPVGGTAAAGTLNYVSGVNANDQFVAPIDAEGNISISMTSGADFVIDVSGYLTEPTANSPGSVLRVIAPKRVADTRSASATGVCDGGTCASLVAQQRVKVKIAGVTPIDTDAKVVMASISILAQVNGVNTSTGCLRVGPTGTTGTSTAGAATINYLGGTAASRSVMVPVNSDGTVTLASDRAIDVVIDVGAYGGPPATDTWAYRYDSTGTRTAKSKDGGTETEFSWDTSGGLPLLTRQQDTAGDTYLIYGPGGQPIEQVNVSGSTSTATFLHHDQLGSVRLATSTTGAVVATRDWDAHGNPTVATGTAKPLLGYAGQYTDAETGFQYLRARYYDFQTSQFTSVDPIRQVTQEPYSYASGNPANGTDPSGLCGPFGDGPCNPITIIEDICVDMGDNDSCDTVAESNPNATQTVVDAAGGALSVNPITATMNSLGLSDTSQRSDTHSAAFAGGAFGMAAAQLPMILGSPQFALANSGLGATQATATCARKGMSSWACQWAAATSGISALGGLGSIFDLREIRIFYETLASIMAATQSPATMWDWKSCL